MTTLSDQLRFLVEEGNVTSGQDAEFLRQTQVAAGRVSPVCICPLDDAPIDSRCCCLSSPRCVLKVLCCANAFGL